MPEIALFFILITAPSLAHAYLDPGAGSLLIQLVLGGVAGLLIIGRLYFGKIKSLLGMKENNENGPSKD